MVITLVFDNSVALITITGTQKQTKRRPIFAQCGIKPQIRIRNLVFGKKFACFCEHFARIPNIYAKTKIS